LPYLGGFFSLCRVLKLNFNTDLKLLKFDFNTTSFNKNLIKILFYQPKQTNVNLAIAKFTLVW